ncbi:MAG: hypothetical protein LBH40_01455 [Alphaproteobacteria bacterium]|jgi:predicted RND superfamily exporter protein|nr:hypothetical protein [Alphaproteobacteria bacterium]
MKKEKLISFFKNTKNIVVIGCLILITFLAISNFNLVRKNNKYKEYLTQTIITLEQYDKELQKINESVIRLSSNLLKCKG